MLIACRRHWMYLYPRLVGLSLLAIVPVVVLTVGLGLGPGLDGTLLWIVIVVDAVWVAFWLVRLYFTWFRYNNDMWVVKNKRIVDSIRRHGFHHQMASAELIDVEDMATAKEGLLPTLFDFGDVRCQTAGTESNFVLPAIPGPAGVLGTIDAARDAARQVLARPALQLGRRLESRCARAPRPRGRGALDGQQTLACALLQHSVDRSPENEREATGSDHREDGSRRWQSRSGR